MATFSMFFNGGNGVAFNFVMNDMAGRASERATQVAARTMCVEGGRCCCCPVGVVGGRLVGGWCLVVVYDNDGGGGPLSPA